VAFLLDGPPYSLFVLAFWNGWLVVPHYQHLYAFVFSNRSKDVKEACIYGVP
jgi:hypothetical protein